MRTAIWVLGVFAALWGVAAIVVGGQPIGLVVVPIAVSAAVLAWGERARLPARDPATGGHIGRLVGIWSGVEGVAMFLTANVLINLHRPSAVMPAFAVIVGLHFLPLARGIPARLYYLTGTALIILGAAALALPDSDRALATGIGAAAILWASAVAVIARATLSPRPA